MGKVSTLRKLGAVAHVAHNQAGRSRTLGAIKNAARAMGRSFAHTLHLLWLEVTGTVFLAIAAFGGFELVRECMKYQAGQTTASRVGIAVGFTLVFAWFGLSSFLRVRRKRQRS